MRVSFVLLLLALNSLSFSDASVVCDDPTSANDIAVATNEIVNRLMGMRKPDWGWGKLDPAIIAGLQLSTPKKFFGRDKAAKTLENKIRDTFHRMPLRQKTQYIIAAKALCMNPYNVSGVNMVESIKKAVLKEFPNKNAVYPADGYSKLFYELGALCVVGDAFKKWVVEKIIPGQNKDGSFGIINQFFETSILLQSMQCVADAPVEGIDVAKLKESIRKMHRYVVRSLEVPGARESLMKNPPTASMTMIALWKTRGPNEDPNKQWSCSDITNVLGIFPLPGEGEIELISRLMRLHGVSYMNVGHVEYKCIGLDEINPVPENYSPTCNHDVPKTCQLKKKN